MPQSPAAQRWAAIVTELEESGLSARAFAERRGIRASTLSWWRSRLRRAEPAAFIAVRLPPRDEPVVRVEVCSRGVYVLAPAGADLAWLRQVVEALA